MQRYCQGDIVKLNGLTTNCDNETGVWTSYSNDIVCNSLCDDKCKNGGVCGVFNTCECKHGYAGEYCEIKVCPDDPRKVLNGVYESMLVYIFNHVFTSTLYFRKLIIMIIGLHSKYKISIDNFWNFLINFFIPENKI